MAEETKKYTKKDLSDLLKGLENYEELSAYFLDDESNLIDADAPYEDTLEEILKDKNALNILVEKYPSFLKKYNRNKREGKNLFDPSDINLKNIASVLSSIQDIDEDDIRKNSDKYSNLDAYAMKKLIEKEGWRFGDVLNYIADEQTKQNRQDIYDDNTLTRLLFPRITEALKETGDYSGKDIGLDLAENALQFVPLAGPAAKVAGIGTRAGLPALKNAGRLGRSVLGNAVENLTVPATMALADYIAYDDETGWDALQKALIGAGVNAAAGKVLKSGLGSIFNDPSISKKIDNILSTGDEAYRAELNKIETILSQGRAANPEEYKKALNELMILRDKGAFTNKANKASIGDYAAKNSNSRKVGKANRAAYEKELEEAAAKGSEWAKGVKEIEKQLANDANVSPYLVEDVSPLDIYTKTNREQVFPHNFIDTKNVGSSAGLLKRTGSGPADIPDFNIFIPDNLEASKIVDKELEKIAGEHASKKFQYSTPTDEIITKLLSDENFANAVKRAYGDAVRPRDFLSSYITNKLGKETWLKRQEGAFNRLSPFSE